MSRNSGDGNTNLNVNVSARRTATNVDRSADMIEHVLGGELVARLEEQLVGSAMKTPAL